MARTRIYIRRSNDEQSTFSIAAQEQQNRAWCAQHNHEVIGVYIDDDASGRKDTRDQFQQLLADAKHDPGSVVVVNKVDRLARKAQTVLSVAEDFEQHRVTFVSVHEQIDFSTPSGRMMLTYLAGVAEYHSRNLASEVSKGLCTKAAAGGVIGDVSYGYVREFTTTPDGTRIRGTERLVASPDAPTVGVIFTRYATGCYGDLALAKALNAEGFTFCRKGHLNRRVPFTADTIGGILTNRIYIGEVTYKGEARQGTHAPLVDRDLFEQVQAIRQRRTIRGTGGRPVVPDDDRYLSEIGYCAICGAPMHFSMSGNAGYRRGYYACGGKRKRGTCTAKNVRARETDQAALDVLRMLTIPPHLREAAIALAQRQLTADAAPPRDTAKLTAKLQRLKRFYLDGEIEKVEYQYEADAIRAQLAAATPAEQRIFDITKAAALLGDMSALLATATPAEQRALVHQVIDVAWIDASGIRAIRPAPAFRLLAGVLVRGNADQVTPTGFEPVTFSSGG